jgi:hypothetical protein
MSESLESYFRVSSVLRVRKKSETGGVLRPLGLASIRSEIEMHLHSSGMDKEEKLLTEKMFELILGTDLRLQRIENQLEAVLSNNSQKYEAFMTVPLELGAEGFVVKKSAWPFGPVEAELALDILVPVVPEWPLQVKVQQAKWDSEDSWHFRFSEIYNDDREMIHRYLRIRERELLRSRSKNS